MKTVLEASTEFFELQPSRMQMFLLTFANVHPTVAIWCTSQKAPDLSSISWQGGRLEGEDALGWIRLVSF